MKIVQRRTGAFAFVGYLAVSAIFLVPGIAGNPTGSHIGGLFTDPQIGVWSLAWWPHAILHGENPFYTHAIWAPNGVNLTWTASIPALSIVLAPLTLALGPIFSYNVACILMPALAAWSAFLLCRYLSGQAFPALVGGYVFGFSSFVLSAELTHVHTAAVFVLPLVALLIVRFVRGAITAARLTLMLGALLALEAGLSTEILFQLTLALAVALALALVLLGDVRPRLVRLLPPLAGAYGVAAIVAAPFVYYVVTASNRSPNPVAATFTADLLNFAVPTRATVGGWWSSAVAASFPGNDVERGAYLGLPLLLIVAWFAATTWRQPRTRFLLACFLAAVIASLGSWLTVDGHRLFRLPWALVASRPVFENVMPVRFAVYCALVAAVIVTLWMASRRPGTLLRILVPTVAVAALVPNLTWRVWARTPDVPALFTTSAYRDCIPHGANVIVFPIGPSGDSMIWQADSHFWFRMAGGYITPAIPPSFLRPPGITHLTTNDHPAEITAAAVRELARLKGASTVVVDAKEADVWLPILRPLGVPQHVDGTWIYRLAKWGGAARCARAGNA